MPRPYAVQDMLKDSFNRIHSYLRLSVTDRCNFRCRYCLPAEGIELTERSEILSPEEMVALAQIFADLGVRKVRITGGEPLVRRGLGAILAGLASVQPKLKLALTTNGLLLTAWLDRLAAAGVDHLNISLDSLKPDRFRFITGYDGWGQVWDGIQAALRHPGVVSVKVNVVMQRGVNDDEIGDFAQLTYDYPLEVRFIELMPVGAARWNPGEWSSTEEVVPRLPGLERIQESEAISGPARLYKLSGAVGRIGLISGESGPACSECNRLRLTARGELLRCLFDPAGLDLRAAIRSGQPEEWIKESIEAFLLGKMEMGFSGMGHDTIRPFSLCLAQVGG